MQPDKLPVFGEGNPDFIDDDQEQEDIEIFDPTLTYNNRIDWLRLVLMLFVSINSFGFVGGRIGSFISIISGFAPIAYFIISGFLVLGDDELCETRIKHTLLNTFLTFIIMTVTYFIINAVFYALGHQSIFSVVDYTSPKFWIDFLLLNIWPYSIGDIIWYIQSLLFAYTVIYIIKKIGLLRFDFIFFILLSVLHLVTSEFSGFFGFEFMGETYISHSFVTFALPYLFLGSFLHRKLPMLLNISPLVYIIIGVLGLAMTYFEGLLLVRAGWFVTASHFVGLTVTAFSVCMITVTLAVFETEDVSYFTVHAPMYFKWMYYLLQPVSVAVAFALTAISPYLFYICQSMMWLICLAVTFIIALVIGFVHDIFFLMRKYDEE